MCTFFGNVLSLFELQVTEMQLEVASTDSQNLLSHRIKMFRDGLRIKLDPKLEQYFRDFFLAGHLSVGRPAIPVCPGLRVGPGNGSFRNARLGGLATLSLCLCPWRSYWSRFSHRVSEMARSSFSCLVLTAVTSGVKGSLFPESFSNSSGESSGLLGWVQILIPK